MKPTRCLVIGANGQLGRALRGVVDGQFVDIETIDIADRLSLDKIDWSKIGVIINAAAYTAVDQAETDDGRKIAWRVNVEGVKNLAKIALERRLILVHISSDYVFDGSQEQHLEDEPFSPLGVYGATKAAGDALAQTVDLCYIIRTSWVVGDGKNFVRTMVGLAEKGIAPTVVNDQFGRLTFADELARGIVHLLTKKAKFGSYNLTNSGETVSWADIAERIFKTVGASQKIVPISTEEYNRDRQTVAPRPRHSALVLDKIRQTGFNPEDWEKGLERYLQR